MRRVDPVAVRGSARAPGFRWLAGALAWLVLALGLVAGSPGLHARLHAAAPSAADCGHGCEGHGVPVDPSADHDCPVTHLASATLAEAFEGPACPALAGHLAVALGVAREAEGGPVSTRFARGPPAGIPSHR